MITAEMAREYERCSLSHTHQTIFDAIAERAKDGACTYTFDPSEHEDAEGIGRALHLSGFKMSKVFVTGGTVCEVRW